MIQNRIIAAVDLNARAEGVILHAAKLAALCHAQLIVAHAVDYDGFESDHVPFNTPSELRRNLLREGRERLSELLSELGMGVEVVVEEGRPREVIARLAATLHARYVVTGRLRWGAFSDMAHLPDDPRIRALGCEVLSVGGEGGRLGRMISDLFGRAPQLPEHGAY